MLRSSVRRLLALAAAALSLPLLVAPPAHAAPPSYVALGDSYSSGVGTRTYLDDGTSCQRSVYAFPSLIAAARGYALNFRACSGAKVSDVTNTQLGALGAGTGYVTISVGGNDAGFTSVITTCAEPAWLSDCKGAVNKAQGYIKNTLPGSLATLYSSIRAKAPNATVVVVGYPRLFNGEDCNALTWFSPSDESLLNATADLLNSKLAAAAAARGFAFANPTSAFIGHAVCGDPEWLNGLSNPISESYHPNRIGHASGLHAAGQLVADRFLAAGERRRARQGAGPGSGARGAAAALRPCRPLDPAGALRHAVRRAALTRLASACATRFAARCGAPLLLRRTGASSLGADKAGARVLGSAHAPDRRPQDPARRERPADALVQRPARPADAPAAGPPPGHRPAGRARGPRPVVPDGPDPAGGLAGAVRRDPRRGARRLPPLAAVAAVPRPPAGEGARDAGADLLQVRRRLAGRLAQAEHRRAAGVLQQAGGHLEAHDRDRGRSVGHGAGVRLLAVRPGVRDLAGAGVVRPEAVPPDHDRDVRRHRAPEPERPDRGGPDASWRRTPTPPARSGSRSARRSRSRPSAATPTTPWAACSTTCCCTRP